MAMCRTRVPHLFTSQITTPVLVGMMQPIHDGPNAGPSSVVFLPMIDLIRPGNLSCIHSNSHFLSCDHARRYSVIPMVTYDKPIWWKALTIIKNEPESSALRQIVGWLSYSTYCAELSYQHGPYYG